MNFKTTNILFGTLLAVIAVFALTQLFSGRRIPPDVVFPSISSSKVTDSDITRLEIEHPDGSRPKLVFERKSSGERWRLTQPFGTAVESIEIDNLVRRLVGLKLDAEASAKLPSNPAASGLEPPRMLITFAKGSDQSWHLKLGNERPGSGRRRLVYALSSDRPGQPVALAWSDVEEAFKDLKDLRAKTLVLESNLNALSITLNDGKQEVKLVKTDDAPGKLDTWRFEKPDLGEADWFGEGTANIPAGKAVIGIASVRDLMVAVENLKVGYNPELKIDDFVADNVPDQKLAEYGLEKGKPATLRIDVTSKLSGLRAGDTLGTGGRPVSETLLIGKRFTVAKTPEPKKDEAKKDDKKDEAKKDDKKDEAKKDDKKDEAKKDEAKKDDKKDEKPSEDDDYYYARLESENNVVRIQAKHIDPILKVLAAVPDSLLPLRNRDLVQLDTSKVDAIDIHVASGTVKLRKVGDPADWKLWDSGSYRDADQQAVDHLLKSLTAKRQVKDFPALPDDRLWLDEKANPVSVLIWEEGIKDRKDTKAEPKLGAETVKLLFSKEPPVKEVIYSKRIRGKEQTRLAVPEGLQPLVIEGKLRYLSKTLPTFKNDDPVDKLVIVRPGQTVELELEKQKDEKTGTWKIKAPAEQAGRKADSSRVQNIISRLQTMHPTRLMAEKAEDKYLAEWGLQPADYKLSLTVKKGDKSEDWVYLFGKTTQKNDGRYAKQGDRDLVFLVPPELTDMVNPEKVKDFVDLQILNFDAAKVRELKLVGWRQVDKATRTLHVELKETKKDGPKTWVLTEENLKLNPDFQLDTAKVTGLATALAKLEASCYLMFKGKPKDEYQLDEKNRRLDVEVVLDGEKNPVKLTIGALLTEGEMKGYAAAVASQPGDVFLLPESRFKELLDKGLGYFAAPGK